MSRSRAHFALLLLLTPAIALCAPTLTEQLPAIAQTQTSELDQVIAEGNRLLNEGSTKSLKKAIELFEKAVQLSRSTNAQDKQALSLLILGRTTKQLGDSQKSLNYYNQALPLWRVLGDRGREATTLNNIGRVYHDLNDKQRALDYYNQALPLRRAVGDRSGEAVTLVNIGASYFTLGEKQKALDYYNQALSRWRTLDDRAGEATTLNMIISVYEALGEKKKVLDYYQQSLSVNRAVGDQKSEAVTLNNIAGIYDDLGERQKALDYYNQALLLRRAVGDRAGEARTLNNIGRVYNALGEKQKALDYYNQALPLRRAIGDRAGEAVTLNNIGRVYDDLDEKQKALDFYTQALPIRRAVGDRPGEAATLGNMGGVYSALGQKQKALDYYTQALPIFRAVNDRASEAATLNNIGGVYNDLGQQQKALDYYTQALPVFRAVGNRPSEAVTLSNIGGVYGDLGQQQKALDFYTQALPIFRAVGNRAGEAATLNNIGRVYDDLGEKQKALGFYTQALPIRRAVGDRSGEAATLNNIGNVYDTLGQKQKALDYYTQALPISRAVGDRSGEAVTLNNIGAMLAAQKQPELAIAFYKESVNVYESIRTDNQKLPRELRESYTQTIAYTYRNLADLLITQGRLPEAQAVLELLKLRELREFTRDAGIQSAGISLAKVEEAALKQILQKFMTVGNFSQTLTQCQQTKCPNLRQLEQQRDALNIAVQREMREQRAILAKHFSTEAGSLTPEKLNAEARRIVNAQPGTVLIYPLVLNDKIQFLAAFQAGNGGVTFRPFETNVTAEQLFQTIKTFQDQLKPTAVGTPKTDLATVQATSQQLYTWLIKPLEAELKAANIKHLVFAPDSTIRYIPLAALYDGKQYLIQRFTVSTITAASQTDTTTRTPKPTGQEPMLLAMGASTFPNQAPLPNVPAELDAIARTNPTRDRQGIYPGSKFLNQTFDYAALQTSLKKGTYRILHLATHGAFIPGRVEDSYLVPGRGQNLTTELIDQLGNYGLSNIHLVVLSACETAVGGRASDGMEIPGMSYFFLKNEVKSVIASLWIVNDASTALIMKQFYKHLADGMTKAEALKTVQQDFIQGKLTANDAPTRADIQVTLAPGTRAAQGRSPDFSHPYYWAPFILIGNSL